MTLYHYSSEPHQLDLSRTYDQAGDLNKPRGLWLSAECGTEEQYGWRDWCEGEEWNLDGLR